MYKVYLAVGNEGVENYIKSQKPFLEKMLNDTVNFVGVTVYKEGALQGIKDYHPDVIILREGLHGSLDILDLIYKIRLESSNTRIIFITKTREIGDAFLAATVQMGVYDLIIGDKISIKDLLKKIVYPTKFVEVAHFVPRVTVDEKTSKKIFSAPDVDALVKQRVEELAVQQETPSPTSVEQQPVESPLPPLNILKDSEDTRVVVTEVQKDDEPILVAEYTNPEITLPTTEQSDKQPVLEISPVNPIQVSLTKEEELAEDIQVPETIEPIFIPPLVENTEPNDVQPSKSPYIPDEPAHTEFTPTPAQNPYTSETFVPEQNQVQKNTTSKKGFALFKRNKQNQKTISSQIITFWGGGNGVGNSQVAFNTAISLANKGYHVIYVDLNDQFSSIESMMQLGFEDLGIDTMLNSLEQNKTDKVGLGISSISKILPFTDKRDFLYKTYTNMPESLNFAFFSQYCFDRKAGVEYNIDLLKDLNIMFLMDFGYDVIILDAPADATNRATQLALAYSNKVFVTLNQDKTVLSRLLKQMKYLSCNRINIRDKAYFIINKFESNAFSYNNLSNFISMNLQYENLELLSIPNLSKEFTNSIYNGLPIILSTKNKELLKTIGDITTLIET